MPRSLIRRTASSLNSRVNCRLSITHLLLHKTPNSVSSEPGAAQMWTISAKWEALASGPPEERACFGELSIKAHDISFTEGNDAIAKRLREGPLVSVYHFAEWVAWNWWRL